MCPKAGMSSTMKSRCDNSQKKNGGLIWTFFVTELQGISTNGEHEEAGKQCSLILKLSS